MGQSHVGWYPFGLVNLGSLDLLPSIPRDIIHLNSINNLLLIDSSSKSKDVVVLESAERSASTRHFHFSDHLPFVFLRVIHLALSIDSVAYESSHHIDEVFDGANGVISMGVVHGSHLFKIPKEFIISETVLEINFIMLDITTC